ncbi:MAG TPA: hypothetical protein VK997_12570 [Deferrisomatales bacterium]|nr:hypothetical protein [Deferrisomatales bacterium]
MRWIARCLYLGVAVLLLVSGTSCTFVDSVIDKTSQVAGDMVGKALGERVGGRAVAGLPPESRNIYVAGVFNSFFYVGGYEVGGNTYAPGGWTRWSVTGAAAGEEYEKAFLKRDGEREWWRIATLSKDDGKNEEVVLEALFSGAGSGAERKLLRMRGQFPGDEGPGEMPVQENTGAWYHEPVRFTPESMEGALQGEETLTTPAGTFRAKHLVYKVGGSTLEWWLSDSVPGGMVQYRIREQGGEEVYTSQLIGHGTDATTRLGSF